MNILFLDQFSEIGGAQRGLLDVLQAVEERGWKAHVLIPGGGPLVEQLLARGVAVDEIPCGPYQSGSKSPSDFLRFAFDVRRQIRVIRDLVSRTTFDLIYVNGPRLLPAAAIASERRLPVLFHLHSHINQRYAVRLARWCSGRADVTVVACSRSAAGSVAGIVPLERVHVIVNGIAEIPFRQRAFNGDWCIGMVGRISPEKGQIEFLKAVAVLRAEFPNIRFLICGAPLFAMDRYFDQVCTEARGLNVEFLGWREDVASVFAELDVLVVPSKQEAMGRVLVEAFSAGVPVVAFPVGGIPEVIANDETGFLVQPATPEALAVKLRELLTGDPKRLRAVAANARRAWEEHHTLASYQATITDLMWRLVSDRRAERERAAPPQHT
ncbi:MAG TPA: glycosyltransferase family 4 protein [Bryobacteraceae bacterium]|nr:glycosyltransferase family 4 protein [Bryobacteraceae bacterium]